MVLRAKALADEAGQHLAEVEPARRGSALRHRRDKALAMLQDRAGRSARRFRGEARPQKDDLPGQACTPRQLGNRARPTTPTLTHNSEANLRLGPPATGGGANE